MQLTTNKYISAVEKLLKNSLLPVIIVICGPAYAQQLSIGADMGMSVNTVNLHAPLMNDLKAGACTGTAAMLACRYRFFSSWFVELRAGVLQKNYEVGADNVLYQRYNNNYLFLPLTAGYDFRLLGPLNMQMAAGIYYAYWLNGTISGRGPNLFQDLQTGSKGKQVISTASFSDRYSFQHDLDQRREYGPIISLGSSYALGKRWSLQATLLALSAFSSQDRSTGIWPQRRYNRTGVISLAVRYAIAN